VDHTFDPSEQNAVAAYLNSEGALFVSGSEIGWDLAHKGNGIDFYQNYLGADLTGDDAGTYIVTPTAEGIFVGLGPFDFRDNYDADWPDQLAPRPGSISALEYAGGDGGIAAVQYQAGGCRRVVYLGFPFETIDAAARPAVMARVLGYLGADRCLVLAPRTAITVPVHGGAYNAVPPFGGVAVGTNPIDRVEVQISDPLGRYWDGVAWITASQWLTAIGTAAWHYPLPPTVLTGTTSVTTLDQGEHQVWARAWDMATVPDGTPAFASFIFDTIAPATPTLLAPANGITVTTAPTGFFWQGPFGDTGSALGYNLQIGADVLTRTVTYYLHSGLYATGVHTWRVRAFDAAGNRSPWTFDRHFVVDRYAWHLPLIFKGFDDAGPKP
jgi:hypothetical protein